MSLENASNDLAAKVFVFDNDEKIRLDLVGRLEQLGHVVEYVSTLAKLKQCADNEVGCMIGYSLTMVDEDIDFPFDVIGHPPANNAIGMAVSIVHDPIGICEGGGIVFLGAPFTDDELNEAVGKLVKADRTFRDDAKFKSRLRQVIRDLPECEAKVMQMIYDGMMNKNIARRLGVSLRTIETDRANLFQKFDCDSAVSLTRILGDIGYGDCGADSTDADSCPIE